MPSDEKTMEYTDPIVEVTGRPVLRVSAGGKWFMSPSVGRWRAVPRAVQPVLDFVLFKSCEPRDALIHMDSILEIVGIPAVDIAVFHVEAGSDDNKAVIKAMRDHFEYRMDGE